MTPLFGHDSAVAAFSDSLASGRLHHAWLITGPRGVGKGLFARKAGLRAVAEGQGYTDEPGLYVPDDHPAARWIAAEAHPDFKVVEREVWEKNKKDVLVPKDRRGGDEELARNIRVVQIRWLCESLASTTSMSKRRAVVIDSVDDLEDPAANALLKSLEEPPVSTVFLLVSHSPERLLPTIRSRCRQLRLTYLDDEAMTSALEAALPEADSKELSGLIQAGQGSPGRALAFRGLQIDALDKAMRALADKGDPTNARRSELSQTLSGKAAQQRYEAFLARAPSLIAEKAKERRGPALANALQLWERASDLAASATRLSLDQQSVVFELAGMLAALAPSSPLSSA